MVPQGMAIQQVINNLFISISFQILYLFTIVI